MLYGLIILVIYLTLVFSLRAVSSRLYSGMHWHSASWMVSQDFNFIVKWIDHACAYLFGTDVVIPNALLVKSINSLVFGLPDLFLVKSVSYIRYSRLRVPVQLSPAILK